MAWEAVVDRLAADERRVMAEGPGEKDTKDHDTERHEADDSDDGWEEHKGEDFVQYEQQRQGSHRKADDHGTPGQKPPLATTRASAKINRPAIDVALTASGERQLRVAGTFRRAIRSSVRNVVCSGFYCAFTRSDAGHSCMSRLVNMNNLRMLCQGTRSRESYPRVSDEPRPSSW